jgi:hypothetical protein
MIEDVILGMLWVAAVQAHRKMSRNIKFAFDITGTKYVDAEFQRTKSLLYYFESVAEERLGHPPLSSVPPDIG